MVVAKSEISPHTPIFFCVSSDTQKISGAAKKNRALPHSVFFNQLVSNGIVFFVSWKGTKKKKFQSILSGFYYKPHYASLFQSEASAVIRSILFFTTRKKSMGKSWILSTLTF